MVPSGLLQWHPIELFDQRFGANLAALASREPKLAPVLRELAPSAPHFAAADGQSLFLGRTGTSGIEMISDPLPPPAVRKMILGMFPRGHISWPLVIGGLGYGWMWDQIAKLPGDRESLPGYRPPIYCLTGNLEQLWAVLHVMDWRAILADARFKLFVGPDAARQMCDALVENQTWPRPRACVRIEQNLFEQDFGVMLADVGRRSERKLSELAMRLSAAYPAANADDLAQRLENGRLRILGITSRYTTFLQHSMRDWLDAFARLGHETRLLLEDRDHSMLGPYGFAQGVLDFRPDLIVIIDHYRAELGGAVPAAIPCVMWVQDRLPGIFSSTAGAAQGRRDYCLGFGRLHLSSRYGYRAERFMTCTIGVNEQKYASVELSAADLSKYACDVSYVSHAGVPPDALVKAELARHSNPHALRLLWDFHDKMVAHFEAGGEVLAEPLLRRRFMDSIRDTRVEIEPGALQAFLDFFSQHVNNAIFRQQTVRWLAELGVNLHLWGNGWDQHPMLKRFARGVADNQIDLPKIYRASKINLQATPHGAVHQRLLDGLAAGGFFLVRYTPGDVMGLPYQKLWGWCVRHGIGSEPEMRSRADDEARQSIATIDALLGYETAADEMKLYDCLKTIVDEEFASLADAVWPMEYPQIAFKTQADLEAKLTRYLGDPALRGAIAEAMRQVVIERYSYRSISRRLLSFVAADVRSHAVRVSRAAA